MQINQRPKPGRPQFRGCFCALKRNQPGRPRCSGFRSPGLRPLYFEARVMRGFNFCWWFLSGAVVSTCVHVFLLVVVTHLSPRTKEASLAAILEPSIPSNPSPQVLSATPVNPQNLQGCSPLSKPPQASSYLTGRSAEAAKRRAPPIRSLGPVGGLCAKAGCKGFSGGLGWIHSCCYCYS